MGCANTNTIDIEDDQTHIKTLKTIVQVNNLNHSSHSESEEDKNQNRVSLFNVLSSKSNKHVNINEKQEEYGNTNILTKEKRISFNKDEEELYLLIMKEIEKHSVNIKLAYITDLFITKNEFYMFKHTKSSYFKLLDQDELNWNLSTNQHFKESINKLVLSNKEYQSMISLDFSENLKEYSKFTYHLKLKNIFNDYINEIVYEKGKFLLIVFFNHNSDDENLKIEYFFNQIESNSNLNLRFVPILINNVNVDEKSIRLSNKIPIFVIEQSQKQNIFYEKLKLAQMKKGKYVFISNEGIIEDVSSIDLLSFHSIFNMINQYNTNSSSNINNDEIIEKTINRKVIYNKKSDFWKKSYLFIGKIRHLRILSSRPTYSIDYNVLYNKLKFISSKSSNEEIYQKIKTDYHSIDSNFYVSYIKKYLYTDMNSTVKEVMTQTMTKLEFPNLDFSIDCKVSRRFNRNIPQNDYFESKTVTSDLTVKLGKESCDYEKSELYSIIKESLLKKINKTTQFDYINFICDDYEVFDDKYTKPKVVLLFYTTDDDDVLKLLTRLISTLNKSMLIIGEENFHMIFFRRQDSSDCVFQNNNENEIPDLLKERKIVKLPKKLNKIYIQDLYPVSHLILTNQNNEVIYFGNGMDIDIEKSLINILGNSISNQIVYYQGFPIYIQKMRKIKEDVRRFTCDFTQKLNKSDKYYYKPYIDFSYTKTFDYSNMNISQVKYCNFKLSVTVKDIHAELEEDIEVKSIKSYIENNLNGLFIFDSSSESVFIKIDNRNCLRCSKHTSNEEGFYYDQVNQMCYCQECEKEINQQEMLMFHCVNLIFIRYNTAEKAILKEVFKFSYEKYIDSERNIDESDQINCCICNETLLGDDIVWMSLIHLYNDYNINENLIICNRKCFGNIINRERFSIEEKERTEKNCIDMENFVFRKIILPRTGY